MTFSLIDSPWIPVRLLDGTAKTFGLRELFTRAHDIAFVADEVPTSTMGLHRLLLAVFYRAAGPRDMAEWISLWRRGVFDETVTNYLAEHAEEFDLFHPKKPFFQTRSIEQVEPMSVLKLWYLGADSSTFFKQASWDDPEPVPAAKAARMMIAMQYFGRPGLYSGLPGESRSALNAPLTDITSVLIEGNNLFETLLLNTPAVSFLETIFGPVKNDLPWWERDESITASVRPSTGYLDLLTRPSRRIFLHADPDLSIRKINIMKGMEFPNDETRPLRETMAPYRHYEGKPLFIKWTPDMLAWQNSQVLFRAFDEIPRFQSDEDKAKKKEPDPIRYHPSRTVEWLAQVAEGGQIEAHQKFQIAVFGTFADGNKGKIDFWRHEHLPLRTAFIADPQIAQAIREAINTSRTVKDLMRWAFRKGASDVFDFGIRKMPGLSAQKTGNLLAEVSKGFMATLDGDFRHFLEDVQGDTKAALDTWGKWVAIRAESYVALKLDSVGSGMRGAMMKGSVSRRLRGAIRNFMTQKEAVHVPA